MVRIAPVRLSFNPKTLWFDAGDLVITEGEAVVVSTARGTEFGHLAERIFDMDSGDVAKLDSPLKPVLRIAAEADIQRADECAELSRKALPIFKRIAAEKLEDMHPIAVEYLFDADKAVFYFEAEERVDFRELVKDLSAQFQVKVDMKQIGVRDGARLVGGIGHCGQEICCRRLGGEFNPVSIRMAKEQDLSLNPQKISGLCGRLLCCLRYEFDAYKDFHSRAPKKNARIETPEGEGKVVELDVPREIISIKVGEEKPVKVPLAHMEKTNPDGKPDKVGEDAWEEAQASDMPNVDSVLHLFGTSQLTGADKLATPGQVSHLQKTETKDDSATPKPGRKRKARRSGRLNGSADNQGKAPNIQVASVSTRKQRRRSTTVSAEGSATTERAMQQANSSRKQESASSRGKSQEQQKKSSKVGRNSSGLRASKNNTNAEGHKNAESKATQPNSSSRRRRRSHRSNASSPAESEN